MEEPIQPPPLPFSILYHENEMIQKEMLASGRMGKMMCKDEANVLFRRALSAF